MNDNLFNFLVATDTLDEFLGKETNQPDNEELDYEWYSVKKGKTDLTSSLMALDKDLLQEKLTEFSVQNIKELKDNILNNFDETLDIAKDNQFSKKYFKNLLEHENTDFISASRQDIENLTVFIYKNGGYYSYYIPDEIKELLKKEKYAAYEEKNIQNIEKVIKQNLGK